MIPIYNILMQNQNQSISISLGQNLSPTSIISHPKDRRFYTTANYTNKKQSPNILSIIDFDQTGQRPKLKQSQIQFQERLQKIVFVTDKKYCVLTRTNQNKSRICVLSESDSENRAVCDFEEDITNLMITKASEVLVSTKKNLLKYDLEKTTLLMEINEPNKCYLDPHHENLLVCTFDKERRIGVYDRSSKNMKFKIENAHNSEVLSVDFNPNKQYYFLSTHEDCLKFWDMRKTNIPIKCCEDHHSLLLDARYNTNYDELVLTSYDDGTLGLFRMTSISSASATLAVSNRDEDGLVKLYDEHEDSVYKLCWASFSPWLFSSISYNSNLIVNSVPSSEKHRILF